MCNTSYNSVWYLEIQSYIHFVFFLLCNFISAYPSLVSADNDDMIVPRTRTARYGPRSFRVAASQIWNMLPPHLKNSSVSREQFKSSLETWLFVQAYS